MGRGLPSSNTPTACVKASTNKIANMKKDEKNMSDVNKFNSPPIKKIAHTKFVALLGANFFKKSSKSGSPSSNKKGGFTLIELMVVIAIIALMSTIVLSALTTAKARSRNAKRLQIVKQYANALELYRSDNGGYPNYSSPYCLGEVGVGVCKFNIIDGSAALNSSLTKYIPGPPAMTDNVNNSASYHGLVYYNCSSTTCPAGATNGYEVDWYMEGINQSCGGGSNFGVTNDPTHCAFFVL